MSNYPLSCPPAADFVQRLERAVAAVEGLRLQCQWVDAAASRATLAEVLGQARRLAQYVEAQGASGAEFAQDGGVPLLRLSQAGKVWEVPLADVLGAA